MPHEPASRFFQTPSIDHLFGRGVNGPFALADAILINAIFSMTTGRKSFSNQLYKPGDIDGLVNEKSAVIGSIN
jgi:hypothetical protein